MCIRDSSGCTCARVRGRGAAGSAQKVSAVAVGHLYAIKISLAASRSNSAEGRHASEYECEPQAARSPDWLFGDPRKYGRPRAMAAAAGPTECCASHWATVCLASWHGGGHGCHPLTPASLSACTATRLESIVDRAATAKCRPPLGPGPIAPALDVLSWVLVSS